MDNAAKRLNITKMLNIPPPKPRPKPTPRPTRPQVTAAAGTAVWSPSKFAAKHGPIPSTPATHAGKVTKVPKPP